MCEHEFIRVLGVSDGKLIPLPLKVCKKCGMMVAGNQTITITGSYIDLPGVSQPTASEGRMYYNSTSKKVYYYNGSEWKEVPKEANPSFSRYWYGDLEGEATYTPSVSGVFFFAGASGREEYVYGTSNWLLAGSKVVSYGLQNVIGDGSHTRFKNGSSYTHHYILMRALVQHTSPNYSRYTYTSLGGGSSYTPSDSGIFSLAAERTYLGWYAQGNSWEPCSDSGDWGTSSAIGDGSHLKVKNDGSSGYDIVIMRWS